MNNIFTLIKANIINSWGINKVLKSKSKGEKIKAVLLGIVIIYAFCMLAFSMFMMSYELGGVLQKLGTLELLISSSILSTTLFSITMSTFKIPGYLFSFKDYDLLMSMPLKPSAILASKMVFIYLSNLLVTVIIGIPPLIIYGMKTSGGALYYSFVAITTLFIPLIPIAIGAFFAYFLGRISTKFRSTNTILLIGSFLLFIAIMVGSTMVGQLNSQYVQNSIPTVNIMSDILFWTKFYIGALKGDNALYLIAFVLISLIIFGVFVVVFSKGFKSINSKLSEKFKASNYKMTKLKASTVLKALYIKELKFYFSSYIYVVNTAFGVIMMTIFSLGIAIFGKDAVSKLLEIPMADAYVSPIVTLMFIFCISFTFITAPSISLEGKSLWIIKALPIKIENVLWSKIFLNMTFTVPALIINTIIVALAFKMDAATVLAIFGVSLLYCLFSPIIGILINLYFPKLEWTTQISVVKQSASVFIAMLAGFLTVGLPAALFVVLKPVNINFFLGIFSIILLIFNVILIKALNNTGVRKFKEL
ncbi:MAG: putative ABC transporter permease subunit [Ruminiclostridium sp.]